ncbi:MAG: rhomboid family intramembrane serine protease [Bacteroidales bacterium]|jgi:membrane associated rhomboid family serine protease|nr:rhomboid family intramembrane serine protease [Bacteroidales bacterium]
MFQQVSPIERIKIFFKRREELQVLILVNLFVWFGIALVSNFAFLFSGPEAASTGTSKELVRSLITDFLAVPANTGVLLNKPWTILTYMFLQIDFLHILFNMLWLYWFGVIFIQYLSQKQLLATYIFGGLAGAVFYIAAFNFFPVFSLARETAVALGASASVLAIVVAIAFYVPDYTVHMLFIGPLKIKYIALITILIDLMMLSSGNAGGHIAHLGGALWGFAYAKMLPEFDPARLLNVFYRIDFNNKGKRKSARFKVHKGGRPLSDDEYNRQKVLKQQKIDSILEKISRSGYDSLSKEEKEILFSNSQKNQ